MIFHGPACSPAQSLSQLFVGLMVESVRSVRSDLMVSNRTTISNPDGRSDNVMPQRCPLLGYRLHINSGAVCVNAVRCCSSTCGRTHWIHLKFSGERSIRCTQRNPTKCTDSMERKSFSGKTPDFIRPVVFIHIFVRWACSIPAAAACLQGPVVFGRTQMIGYYN